jgi:hypothetical protein
MADRLSLANAIAEGGIERDKAERIASQIVEFVQGNVATKADIDLVRADLRHTEATLKGELGTRLTELQHQLTVSGVRALVVLLGLVLAAIRYLPHA